MSDTPLGTPLFVPPTATPSGELLQVDELRLIDERGCLTDEVLCFIEELGSDHRRVVERHLASCPACSFHRRHLGDAAMALRRARPRIAISSDARLLGRQAVLRGMLKQPRFSEPSNRLARRRRRWLHIGLVASLTLVVVALGLLVLTLLSSCKGGRSSGAGKAGPPVRLRATFSTGQRLAQLPANLTAATSGAGDVVIGGTQRGEVVLIDGRGKRLQVVGQGMPASAPTSSAPTSAPASSRPAVPARHRGAISAVQLSADGKRLLTVGGRTVAAWSLNLAKGRATLINHLRGPQILTVGTFVDDGGREAIFGTSQGHLLRWTVAKREATPMATLRCRVHMVSPGRASMPPNRRCPHGTYDTNRKGQGYCAYPPTQLRRRGTELALACRDGYTHILDLQSNKARYRLSGALGGLAFADKGKLLFGRLDGRLQLYDSTVDDVDDSTRELFGLRQPVYALGASGELFAVGTKRSVTLLHQRGKRGLGALRVSVPPLWVGLTRQGETKGALTVILQDGQVARYPFAVRQAQAPSQTPEA